MPNEHDWLIAPYGRTRNNRIRPYPPKPKRMHWFQSRRKSAGCGRKDAQRLEANLTLVTCEQCLYVAWLDEELSDSDHRVQKMRKEHAARLKHLGWKWPKGGTPQPSNPDNPMPSRVWEKARARRLDRRIGRRGRS